MSQFTEYDKIFTFENLLRASYECEKGVKWKRKTQVISNHRLTEIYKLYKSLNDGTYKKESAYHFTLHERGKTRAISGVSYRDRIVQKVLCDHSMIPILCNGIVYTNSASQKGKGTDFARKQFKKHFNKAINRYKENAYILQYDFKSYFNSINSSKAVDNIIKEYKKYCSQNDLEKFSKLFKAILLEEEGIGLGNQTSQVTAIWFPNIIDHYIQEKLNCGLSGRYMDDGYAFFKDKETAAKAMIEIEKIAATIGLKLHPRKTYIKPITSEIVFLKTIFKWNKTNNHLDTKLCHSVLKYNRKHILNVYSKTKIDKIEKESLETSIASFNGVLERASQKQKEWYDFFVVKQIS